MQTHSDDDAQRGAFMDRLSARADRMVLNKESEITAGKEGESVIDSWLHGTIHVTKRPDDEQDILRVSVGGGIKKLDGDYCVFRGDRTQCAHLLQQAAEALRNGHEIKAGGR